MTKFKIRRILVPLDFSDTSLKALDHAIYLAKIADAEITLLHVIENVESITNSDTMIDIGMANYEVQIKNLSQENLIKMAEKIKEKGADKVKTLSVTGRTHKQILDAANNIKADLIIMGTHGVSGFREFVMGSNTYSVVRDAECPVLSVQKDVIIPGFKNILVPFSDRPHSRESVMYAIEVAKLFGAQLHILGIDSDNDATRTRKLTLEAAQIGDIASKYGLKYDMEIVLGLVNSETILKHGEKVNADLIVAVGDANKENFVEYFVGSISQQIVNHSPLPVLSIHSMFNPETIELWHGI